MTGRAIAARLWQLAWPIAITGQLAALEEAIIIYWLGHLLGAHALAVEATLRPVIECIVWALLAIATGVSVHVAQSVGARDGRGLELITSGMLLVAFAWVLLIAIVLPTAGPLSDLLASPEVPASDLRAFGLPAVLLALPGLGMLQVLLFAASGAGWTRLSLARMVADLCVTAVLVPLFISQLGFGLAGAPLGEGISQLVMIGLVWRALYRHRERLHLGEPRGVSRVHWGAILGVGLPPQVARITMYAAYAYLIQRVGDDGRAAVAGFGIALTMNFFAINMSGAVGRATGIELGQRVGAGDRAAARHTLRVGLALAAALGCALLVVVHVVARGMVGLFVDDAAILDRGVAAVRILACALPFLAIAQIYIFAFTAIKAAKRAGLLWIAADVAGVAFAVAWPGETQLAGAAWSIVLANALRAGLFAALGRSVFRA